MNRALEKLNAENLAKITERMIKQKKDNELIFLLNTIFDAAYDGKSHVIVDNISNNNRELLEDRGFRVIFTGSDVKIKWHP